MAQLIAAAERYCASAAGSSDPQIVNEQLQQMVALVSQHASLEERYVYPLFGRYFKGTVEGGTTHIALRSAYDRSMRERSCVVPLRCLLCVRSVCRDDRGAQHC